MGMDGLARVEDTRRWASKSEGTRRIKKLAWRTVVYYIGGGGVRTLEAAAKYDFGNSAVVVEWSVSNAHQRSCFFF